MTKKALVIFAEGAEDIELIIIVDLLRRAEIDVTIGGLAGKDAVRTVQKVMITPDAALADVKDEFDVVIIPGGPGADKLCESDKVGKILQAQYKAKKLIAAICGAPKVLNAHKIAPGCEVTSFPKVKDEMIKGGYKYSENSVVLSDNVLTSRGPGTAPEFALKIVELLVGEQKAHEIKEELLFKF